MHGVEVFLHVDLYKWSGLETSPLWLSLYVTAKADADRIWTALDPHLATLFDHVEDGAIAAALTVPAGRSQDDVLAALEQQLHCICQLTHPDHVRGTAAAETAPSPVETSRTRELQPSQAARW
jgi:hypothetical protein